MRKPNWERLASVLFCFCFGVLALYLGVRYALPILLPFLLSFALSLLIRPLATGASKKLGIPQKLCASLLLVVFWGGAAFLCGALLQRLVLELEHLLERLLAQDGELSGMMHESVDLFETLTSKIGFLRRIGAGERFSRFREQFNTMIADMLAGILSSVAEGIPAFVTGLLSALPTAFLVVLVTVISGFYFCTDGDRVTASLRALLPEAVRQRLPAWRLRAGRASWRYLRAYLLLWLITFSALFLGFCILGVDYALLLALVAALVDMLPVLGVGTVLVPWAVVELLQKEYFLGMGLLILYAVMLILRQIIEPRLVGKSLGLHPLLALFATWVGWRLFGLFGMLTAPFFALLCKTVLSWLQKET